MKKLISIIFAIISISALAQDIEPLRHKFQWGNGGSEIYLSHDSTYFKQRNVLLGWHWGAPRRISEALLVSQYDALQNYPTTANDVTNNCDITLQPYGSSHAADDGLLHARAFQYEPTLNINPNDPLKLNKRSGDTTRPIFGFLNRRGRVIGNPSDVNYNRLIIEDSLINQVVLSKLWPCNYFSMAGQSLYKYPNASRPDIIDSFLCRHLYISINLRRPDSLINGDTVLKIELPYSNLHDSTYQVWVDTAYVTRSQRVRRHGYIRFDSLASGALNDVYDIRFNAAEPVRGRARKLIQAPSNTRAFFITKNMIPPNNQDITISAFFRCDNDSAINKFTVPYGNPELREVEIGIDTLDMKITYLGGGPIMIDWVRIETPHAQRFLRGKYDADICAHVQQDLNKFITSSYTSRGIRLFRYNAIIEGGTQNWIAEKYFNRLVGNISTSEVAPWLPEHYEYYVDPPDRWLGIYQLGFNISAPYMRNVIVPDLEKSAKCANLINGAAGYHDGSIETRPNVSHYETYLTRWGDPIPITRFLDYPDEMADYEQIMNTGNNWWRASFQANIENYVWRNFFKDDVFQYLYSEKSWWAQNFTHLRYGEITDDTNNSFLDIIRGPGDTIDVKSALVYSHRPFTGEEYRLTAMLPVTLGAKGLLYDGIYSDINDKYKSYYYDGSCIPEATRNALEALPDKEFIESELAGPDFLRTENEIMDFDERFYPLDTLAKYLGRPKDKIYMGRKSVRLETRKLHEWIRQVEPTLLNLRLQANYSKGYRRWYNQHQKHYPIDLMYDFLNVYGIRTRRPGFEEWEGTAGYNYQDSSFFNISILDDKTVDSNMTKVFYLGVVNRRTNPLILEGDSLNFYSTNEFDENVKAGGYQLSGQFRDSLYWREKFWQRMGCREIQIPFQYRHGTDNPSTKLRVVELGFDDPIVKSWNWRQPEYYHTVDTVISWDETLSARFLPGEGKILKVTPVNFGESGVDTCQGCEALKNHVRASAAPVRCEGLQHKWDVTLENLSGCDYDNLSLIVKSDDNSAQYLNVGAGNTGFTINQEIANGQRVWTLQGALAQGAEVTFPFSISSAYSVDYQITWGEWVDGMLIECDSALLSGRVVKSDCELIGVTVTDTGDSCLCGAEWKPSEKEITIFVPDTQPCVEEVKITRFLPHINPPLIEELTLAGDGVHVEADSGTYLTFRFCPWEDWQVKVQLFSGDDKLCESEFKSPVCDCDTIKITSIWNMIYPSNDKLGYKFDFRKIIDCATAYDVAEVLPNGALAVVKPNVAIPDTGISGEWLSSADFEFRKYIIIAKNRDCAPPCYSDTIKVPPKHWTNPAQINTTANFLVDSLPCMAGIIATRDDTLSKEIYGITVFEGREPYALLYSEMRNPASQPPIDLRVPGGYHITNIVFPCDSALKLIVKYWDEDTVCVAVGEIDTTCSSGDDYEYLESLSAYPNPASEEVTLDYEMKKGAHVELEIIDAQGNTKKKSIKAFKDKGKHSLTFQLDGLQTGVYYVALRAEGEAMARRIAIIK